MRASDIDIIWQNGYNWPAYQGGPMWWADLQGLQTIVDKLAFLRQGAQSLLHNEDVVESLAGPGIPDD